MTASRKTGRAIWLSAGLALAAASGQAQQEGLTLGGLRTDTSAPVAVDADRLEVDQTAGTALFAGGVVVSQGELRLTAPEILVEYARGGNGAAASGVERITASGGVTLVTPSEAAEAETAIYTPARNEVVMSGDVLLTQGPNTLNGERLVVDLETGSGRIEGRVRTILVPGAAQE